jgi:hypothetical protein
VPIRVKEASDSPMDHYSEVGSGHSGIMSQSNGAAAVRQLARAADLRFPGEDGGESLAAWARRDLEATLQLLADRAQYITGGSGAAIALRDGDFIMCRASSGPSAPQIGSCFEVSSGLSGESVRTRKTLRCDDASADPRVNYDSCKALGIASFAVMPLVRKDEVIGIFEIFSNQPRAFQERDLLALERMGEMVNTALDQVKHPRTKSVPPSFQTPGPQLRSPESPSSEPTPADISKLSGSEPMESASSLSHRVVSDEMIELDPALELESLSQSAVPVTPAFSVTGIGTCARCGFPVSGGRKLCLDCEAASEKQQPDAVPASDAPAFLAGLEAEKSGVKHWIISHRYLLGTIAMTAATVLVLLLR